MIEKPLKTKYQTSGNSSVIHEQKVIKIRKQMGFIMLLKDMHVFGFSEFENLHGKETG